MSYNKRAPLTPPQELVGHFVAWKPKRPDGARGQTVRSYVESYDETARTLTITVNATDWQRGAYERTVTVSLSHGPFRTF